MDLKTRNWLIVGIVIAIVVIVSIILMAVFLTKTKAESSAAQIGQVDLVQIDTSQNTPKENKSKYAIVYVGQLRNWKTVIPQWHDIFSIYKPDVYLCINAKEAVPGHINYPV